MEWTPAGITVKEIVDLLETAALAPVRRQILENETSRLVASLARKGFVRKRPSKEFISEHRNEQEKTIADGIHLLQ
jgi:hypothetical protein